jgi:hypothetical protein
MSRGIAVVDTLWRLRRRLLIGATLLISIPALVAGVVFSSVLRDQVTELRLEQLDGRANWAGDQIVVRLDQLWQQIALMSKKVDMTNLAAQRDQFTLMTQIDDRFSWIGVADASGKVLISSNGMLEGASVAQRPWFKSGLTGPFAGDVHEAVLLQNLLPKRDEPYRFIDFSAPIRNESGQVVGVLGAHFDWVWVMKLVDSFRAGDEDIVLLSSERRVLHGPTELYGQQIKNQEAPPVSAALQDARVELWPDGQLYITQTVPIRTKAGAPSFGWSLAVRSDADKVIEQSREPLVSFWLLLGAAMLITLAGILALITLTPESRAPAPRRIIGTH